MQILEAYTDEECQENSGGLSRVDKVYQQLNIIYCVACAVMILIAAKLLL